MAKFHVQIDSSRACVAEKIEEARSGGDDCCPYGCPGLARTKLTELEGINRIARRVYENILVKCIGAKDGCTWHGKISELQQHRECGCSFVSRKDSREPVQKHEALVDEEPERRFQLNSKAKAKKGTKKLSKNKIKKPTTVSYDICGEMQYHSMMTKLRSDKPVAFKLVKSWTCFRTVHNLTTE